MSAGFYESRVFPWLNDRLNADPALETIRADAVSRARGRVVEIGFGTGLNLAHYPSSVQSVVAVEPSGGMRSRARARIASARFPVEVIGGTAERMPLADAGFDTAVSTLTLCTVADPARVLAELRRVLRPDGRLLLMEHGLSEDDGVVRWQQRLNGLQRILACGCNLNRPIAELVQMHGFRFESLRKFYAPGMPRTHGWVSVGAAVKAV
ncbi:MAG TPA: class I SAM-dependent methyltransferase [Burkholderiaceae bacterium]|nr:class I SAM-dependent methyltransferase [Burkholderiaceae bacterium]